MGVVYLAREVRLDRPVAIKLLPPELAAQERLRDRFLREARTAARLSHPYIVPIHSVDEIDDFVFYVMAYVDGETLAQRVAARGPLPPPEATRVLREVAWALAYAHAQGVVHRDVKPANILLERGTERAMVTDFGIARLDARERRDGVGELLGTPEYMSPEQASGEAVDGRSDLYSLGVVGLFALTGQPPFTAPTTQAVLAQQITKAAPPVSSDRARDARARSRARSINVSRRIRRARSATGEALAEALAPSIEQRGRGSRPDSRVSRPPADDADDLPPVMAVPISSALIAQAHRSTDRMLASPRGLADRSPWRSASPLGILLVSLAHPAPTRLRTERHRRRRFASASSDSAKSSMYEFGTQPSVRERVVRASAFAGIATGGALDRRRSRWALAGTARRRRRRASAATPA